MLSLYQEQRIGRVTLRLIFIVMVALSVGSACPQQPARECEDREVLVKLMRSQKAALRLIDKELAESVAQFEKALIASPEGLWESAEVFKTLWQVYVQVSEEGPDRIPPLDDPIQLVMEAALVVEESILLTPSEHQTVRRIISLIERFQNDMALALWGEFIRDYENSSQVRNIMEILFLVFRESIEATNEDHKYFIQTLHMYNVLRLRINAGLDQTEDFLSQRFRGVNCE